MIINYWLFLCDCSAVVSAKTYSADEGGNITVQFPFYPLGKKKFCRGRCEAGDVLIETKENEARNGRYSIKYEGTGSRKGDLSVTITQLTKSDSGTYQCGLGRFTFRHQEFEIIVTDGEFQLKYIKLCRPSFWSRDVEIPWRPRGESLSLLLVTFWTNCRDGGW